MWTEQLSPNLELLALLDPKTTAIDNVSVTVEAKIIITRPAKGLNALADKDFSMFRRQELARKKAHAAGSPRSSTRGGSAVRGVSRDDVLTALAGVSSMANYFVYGFTGMLQSSSLADYQRLVFGEGLKRDCFVDVTMNDFAKVFAAVWIDLLTPSKSVGTVSGLAVHLGCGRTKAENFTGCYADIVHLVMSSANEVSQALYLGLRRAA